MDYWRISVTCTDGSVTHIFKMGDSPLDAVSRLFVNPTKEQRRALDFVRPNGVGMVVSRVDQPGDDR